MERTSASFLFQQEKTNKGMIPKHIHQIWVGPKPIPTRAKSASVSWKHVHPTYRYTLHRDAECDALISKHYPQYFEVYRSLVLPVQKADLLRYLIIYHYGGYYADMDTTSVKPLDSIVDSGDTCVIGVDMVATDHPEYLQWFFGARARHPAMLQILEVIQARNRREPCSLDASQRDGYTLWLTGPLAFTKGIDNYHELYPESPIRIYEGCVFGNYDVFRSTKCRAKAVLLHHYDGAWKHEWGAKQKQWIGVTRAGQKRVKARKVKIEGFVSSETRPPSYLWPMIITLLLAILLCSLKKRLRLGLNTIQAGFRGGSLFRDVL